MEKVPNIVAICSGIIVPVSFVVYVDWIKKIAAEKIMSRIPKNGNKGNDKFDYGKTLEFELKTQLSYRDEELKYFLGYSVLYILALILILFIIGPYINFDIKKIYFSKETNKPISKKITNTFLVLLINFILYSGLLLQFFMGIEQIYPKTKFCYFMENFYGPILEEFVYRQVLYSIFRYANYSGKLSAIFSSFMFSISHFRHIFDVYFTADRLPSLFFQSFYTFLFGFYTCYAYEYSGTIISAMLLHMVCNTLQLPRFYYLRNNLVSPSMKKIISVTYVGGILGWAIMIYIFH